MRTLFLSLVSFFLLAVPMNTLSKATTKPSLVMEEYFLGKSVAKGIFTAVGGKMRTFDIMLTGSWDGETLTLHEDILFSNGKKDQKTWRFIKLAEGRYRGLREDILGETLLVIEGNSVRFEYDLLHKRKKKKKIKVHFKDTMVLKPNGVIENRVRVTKFGLPIAKIAINYVKSTDLAKVDRPSVK